MSEPFEIDLPDGKKLSLGARWREVAPYFPAHQRAIDQYGQSILAEGTFGGIANSMGLLFSRGRLKRVILDFDPAGTLTQKDLEQVVEKVRVIAMARFGGPDAADDEYGPQTGQIWWTRKWAGKRVRISMDWETESNFLQIEIGKEGS